MLTLLEMAYERADAIERCSHLANKFIQHFHKAVKEGINGRDFHHHCTEMQTWFNTVNKFVLKNNNKRISNNHLIDWFFTNGSSIEYIIEEPYQEIYDKFIIKILNTRNDCNIEQILTELIQNYL